MSIMAKRIDLIPLLFGVLLLLTCCGRKTESESSEPQQTTAVTTTVMTTEATTATTAETTVTTTTTLSPERNPLTGELGFNAAAVGKRPVAVMVNNVRASLPQYGIAAADVIYELPVEAGITRMMAVYADYTAVPDVCSVRSCRYYYPLLCLGMDAVYCHWGMDQTIAKETLLRTGIDRFDGGNYSGTLYFRDESRRKTYAVEHTGYLKGSALPDMLAKKGIRTELDDRNEKIGYKIRYARQVDKVPYMLILGEKEVAEGNVSARDRATDETNVYGVDEFIAKLKKDIAEKK